MMMEPDGIICIRSNHEFDAITKTDCFRKQIFETYLSETGETVYQFILSIFDWMLFSSKIESNIMFFHDGFFPLFFGVNQLKILEILYYDFSNKLVDDIVGFQSSDQRRKCYFEEQFKDFSCKHQLIKSC
jgi:hypothetical protein